MRAAATTTLLALAILAAGCAGPVDDADLAVAGYPAAFVAESLAGDDLSVAHLGTGVGFHDYEPSARDIDQLRHTTYLVLWDEALEPWVHRTETSLGRSAPEVVALRAMPPGEETATDAGPEEPDDGHGHDGLDYDPHTWNDPLAMLASVRLLEDHLRTAYPAHADGIAARADALAQRLEALHARFQAGLDDCVHDTIVTNHEAHNHLARRYGFRLIGLHGIEPGAEPTPAKVEEAIRTIKELRLPVIFIEEGTDAEALQAIQDETGVQVRVLATNEARPATGDYVDAQDRNLEELRLALECA